MEEEDEHPRWGNGKGKGPERSAALVERGEEQGGKWGWSRVEGRRGQGRG